jgi:hypothetical protein
MIKSQLRSGGSRDRTNLCRQSPQNGNIRGQSRRLSAICTARPRNRESRDEINHEKRRDSGPFSRLLGTLAGRTNAWLGRKDSNLDMANWNRMLSPVREEPQNLFSLKSIGPSNRWNFENRTESAESRATEMNRPFGE